MKKKISFRGRVTPTIICILSFITIVLVYLLFQTRHFENKIEEGQYIGVCGVREWRIATPGNSNEYQIINTSPVMTDLYSNKTISDCITHDTIIRNTAVGSQFKQHQLSPFRFTKEKGQFYDQYSLRCTKKVKCH